MVKDFCDFFLIRWYYDDISNKRNKLMGVIISTINKINHLKFDLFDWHIICDNLLEMQRIIMSV